MVKNRKKKLKANLVHYMFSIKIYFSTGKRFGR